jgi:hypothetical protein
MPFKSVIPEPKIVDPEGKQLGSAMSALSLREQVFVMALFEQPTAIKAFEQAGFTSTTRKALQRLCSYYSSLPRIQAAIREEDARRMVLVGAEAQQALAAMVRNPQHQDHYKAVKLARDDAGLTKPVAKVIDMNVSISTEEKVQRIRAWAISRGLDVEKLLGFDPGPAPVDAEFTEVPADEAWKSEDISALL